MNDPDRLLTTEDLAALLQIPLGTIYQWRYRGVGPRGIKVGKYVRYRRSEVEAWLDEQTRLSVTRRSR